VLKKSLDLVMTVSIIVVCLLILKDRFVPQQHGPQVSKVSGHIGVEYLTHSLGDGKTALVEFSDFECPFCQRFHKESFAAVSQMAADHRITFYHIDLPLPQHPMALPAVKISECASPQAYWATYNALFDAVSRGQVPDHDMRFTGRSDPELQSCITRVSVNGSEHIKTTFNVEGTPTFFIGVVNRDGSVTFSKQIVGSPTTEQLRREL
jgi:protein-disulfide isomerase